MEEEDDIEIDQNVKLYETLKRAWNDEKNAPILLKFKSTEVATFNRYSLPASEKSKRWKTPRTNPGTGTKCSYLRSGERS